MHIFHEADGNHKSGTDSTHEKHPDQDMIQNLEKNLHLQSVLPSVLGTHNFRL